MISKNAMAGFLVGALGLLGATSTASAEEKCSPTNANACMQEGTVWKVWQYVNASNYVSVTGATCDRPAGEDNVFEIQAGKASSESASSIALAALLSGRSVEVNYDKTTCIVTSIELK